MSNDQRTSRSLWLFVVAVTAGGAFAIVQAVRAFPTPAADTGLWMAALAILTIVTGGFKIKVPGQPATVSVSEFFVFALLLAFGPGPATLTVAADGLWASLTQTNRRLHRGLFNVAEPALGAWAAGTVYVAVVGAHSMSAGGRDGFRALAGLLAMALTFFVSNSVLTSLAVGLENGIPWFAVWRRHSFYLGMNYYAAAALAMLAVESGMRIAVMALVAPLLALSYVAYRAVSSRVEESEAHAKNVERLYQSAIETLAIAVDAKDQVTHGHVRRVQRHTVALARALGISDVTEIKAIEAAALLHDVGKLAVPDHVLNKPGTLTRSEFEKIKLHVNVGATILGVVDFPYPVVPIVRGHHEQWNGRGYPDGLSGEKIPLGARILTVVDCFDAITSDRPYRRKMTDEVAMDMLRSRSGTMYDPRVVDAFEVLMPELRQQDAAVDAVATPVATHLQTSASVGDGRSTADEDVVPASELALAAPEAFARLKRRLPDAEAGLLFVPSGADKLIVASVTPRVADALAGAALRVGEGIAGWVAANRARIVNSDPALDLGDAAVDLKLGACVSMPVFAFGELVGVLSAYLPHAHGFSDDDVRFVGSLAHEVGIDLMRGHQGVAARR